MSVKYLLPCSCGKRVPVDATQAGERIRCDCGAEMEVPTLMKLRTLEIAPASPQPRRRLAFVWGPKQALMLLGSIFFLVGVGWAFYCLASRPYFVDDRLAPIDALALWEVLKTGVDSPPVRIEQWVSASRDWAGNWAIVGWVAAAIGTAMFFGSFAIPRPGRKSPQAPKAV